MAEDLQPSPATQPTQEVAQAAPASATAPSTPPAPAPETVASPAQAATPASIRDQLRSFGVDTSSFQDDSQALQHLAGVARQLPDLRQLAQIGQAFLPHRDQFNSWMEQQRRDEQVKAQQAQQWWKAPEYDPSWLSRLVRDPQTGELRTISGADPAIAQKYLAWAEHQRSFLDKFSQDPITAIRPGIEQVVEQVAQRLIEQQLGGYRDQQSAQQLVAQHSEWMNARDAQGQPVYDQAGRPVLSELGQRYAGYVQQAVQMGLRDVQAQHNYALGLTQRDYLLSRSTGQQQAQAAQDAGQAAKDAFVNAAQKRSAQAGASPPAPKTPPLGTPKALQDYMMQKMEAAGFGRGTTLEIGR